MVLLKVTVPIWPALLIVRLLILPASVITPETVKTLLLPVAAKPPPLLPKVMPLLNVKLAAVLCKVPPFKVIAPVPRLAISLIERMPPLMVVVT